MKNNSFHPVLVFIGCIIVIYVLRHAISPRLSEHFDNNEASEEDELTRSSSLFTKSSNLKSSDIFQNDKYLITLKTLTQQQHMPLDVAILKLVQMYPEVTASIEQSFPVSQTTRSTFLQSEDQSDTFLNISYEDKISELVKLGFFKKLDLMKNMQMTELPQLFLDDALVRAIFEKALINMDFFGCLVNNLKIGGDIAYCLFSYFKNYPDEYMALMNRIQSTHPGAVSTSVKNLSNQKAKSQLHPDPTLETIENRKSTIENAQNKTILRNPDGSIRVIMDRSLPPSNHENPKFDNWLDLHNYCKEASHHSGSLCNNVTMAPDKIFNSRSCDRPSPLDKCHRQLFKCNMQRLEQQKMLNECGFVYQPKQQWPLGRPPVCRSERHEFVRPYNNGSLSDLMSFQK